MVHLSPARLPPTTDEAAVNEAAAHSAPASASVGELPDEVLRKIWSIRWRADAAEVTQRAVRRAIRLAGGLPWDLPSLVYPDYMPDYSDTRPSLYESGLGSSSEYMLKYCAKMPLMVDEAPLRGPAHLSKYIEVLIEVD